MKVLMLLFLLAFLAFSTFGKMVEVMEEENEEEARCLRWKTDCSAFGSTRCITSCLLWG